MWPTLAQGYLLLLLAAMAVGQLLSWRSFLIAVGRYAVLPAKPLTRAFVAGELAGALLLVVPATRLAGSLVGLGVALAWTALAVIALARHRRLANCGCFGGYLRQPLRWWVIPQDVLFVALAVWAASAELG